MAEQDYYYVLGVDSSTSGEDIKNAYRKLSMKLGEAMYKASQEAQAESGEEASESAAKADGEGATVVDADFEEVEDEKRDKPA